MKPLTITLPEDMRADIDRQAEEHMVSVSAVVRWALEEFKRNDWQRAPKLQVVEESE